MWLSTINFDSLISSKITIETNVKIDIFVLQNKKHVGLCVVLQTCVVNIRIHSGGEIYKSNFQPMNGAAAWSSPSNHHYQRARWILNVENWLDQLGGLSRQGMVGTQLVEAASFAGNSTCARSTVSESSRFVKFTSAFANTSRPSSIRDLNT